jgi:hypothetical protein
MGGMPGGMGGIKVRIMQDDQKQIVKQRATFLAMVSGAMGSASARPANGLLSLKRR